MSNPSMVVRIAANLAELKANLAEGKNQIEATTAGMQKLATSFQGDRLIQQAHNVAAAVNQIGGASKLTDAEQARVNRTVEAALQKYQALGREAPQALQELAAATRRAESPLISLRDILQGMVAGATAAVTAKLLEAGRALVAFGGEALARGAQLEGLRAGFESLAGSAQNAQAMLVSMRGGTAGLVADMDLMQSANKAMLLGLNMSSDEMGDLAQTARVLGRAMGQDATKSLDDLIVALGRSSPMILDNLGLTVKMGEANEAYAAALGKTVGDLTDAEKKQAFMTAAMAAARVKVAELGADHLTLGERLQQATTWMQNFGDRVGEGIMASPVLSSAIGAIGDSLGASFGSDHAGRVQTIVGLVEEGARGLITFGSMALEAAGYAVQAFYGVRAALFEAIGGIVAAEASLRNFSASALETMASVPGVGRAFKDAAAEARANAEVYDAMAKSLRTTADEAWEAANGQNLFSRASDALQASLSRAQSAMASATGAQRESTAAAQAAIAPIRDVGTAIEGVSAKTAATAKEVGVLWGQMGNIVRMEVTGVISPALHDFQTDTHNTTEALQELKDMLSEVAGEAISIGPPLSNAMKLPWATMKQTVSETEPQIQGFFSKVFGGAEGLSGSITSFFQQAFVGGGGALGAAKAFATQTMSTLLGMIPGVGQWAQMFAGPVVEMLSKLGGKVKDFFRGMFGGPSRDELNGRKLVEEFETNIRGLLTSQQQAESGGEAWAQTVIYLRDQYLAMGRTADEAMRDAERLWASSRDGADASRRVIEEINAKIQQQGAAAKNAIEMVTGALADLPRVVDFEIRGRYNVPSDPGYIAGTIGRHGTWFKDFGTGSATMLHGREAVVREDQAVSFARDVLGGGSDPEMKQMLRDLPRLMKLAMREAMAGA